MYQKTSTTLLPSRPMVYPISVEIEPGDQLHRGSDGIRHDLVKRVRQEIEAGTYDSEEKLFAALAVLVADLP